MAIDYSQKIPNNVELSEDRQLQRAIEKWQPHFLDWWKEMGPEGFQSKEVYLRTATSVDAKGWATYGQLQMPDYRWGIFLAEPVADRKIGFGDFMGQDAWQQVPGEFRSDLRRLIVTQGDTEPASVEQQRMLGQTCPSLYDLRNLFQVNVEEGRHLWAMVYLLHAYFGRDGREEAEELLSRHSGDVNNPRILTTFNEPIDDWMSFFCFTYFTDRDGKYQLKMLAESGFDPLSRTCRGRVIKRALEVMDEHKTDDPAVVRRAGAIDLPTIQKYINFWFSSAQDLFGSDQSTNAANYFANGLKGRPDEDQYEDHVVKDGGYELEEVLEDGTIKAIEVPTRNAMNAVARHAYVKDCDIGVKRWNRMIKKAGIDFEISLPSERFRRTVGAYAGFHFTPEGNPISGEQWEARKNEWIPSEEDRAYVRSLMQQVTEPGKMAGWIAPPDRGINNLPVDYEYVKL